VKRDLSSCFLSGEVCFCGFLFCYFKFSGVVKELFFLSRTWFMKLFGFVGLWQAFLFCCIVCGWRRSVRGRLREGCVSGPTGFCVKSQKKEDKAMFTGVYFYFLSWLPLFVIPAKAGIQKSPNPNNQPHYQ
jgi:hypothetical protein